MILVWRFEGDLKAAHVMREEKYSLADSMPSATSA
jgi:hypothetical protein